MFRKIAILAVVSMFGILGNAQKKKNVLSEWDNALHVRPKLVVGIVVDQMRYDYLTRFYARYGQGGFKRLISGGFTCKNNHFNYVPTYTGPGHASIYTGTTPVNHGIISNYWYDKFSKEELYCASDPSVRAVGSDSDMERMSPHRLKTTTICDQNRLHTQMKGKTIGISIKDRGAILPAGHSANGAYWFRGKEEGKWITSTYYRDELPKWVRDFNASGKVESYLKPWTTLHDIETYTESGPDNTDYEGGFQGKKTATFPYDLAALKAKNWGYDIIKETAFGNSLVADFAIEALAGEALGEDTITDFLTVSFSSTDYVGHNFGVNSKEVEDAYLRLDKDLERLLIALDTEVGNGNYTVFLTADHGAVHVPAYLNSVKILAGYFDQEAFEVALQQFVKTTYGVDHVLANVSNNQVFFNYEVLSKHKILPERLQAKVKHFILQYKQVDKVYTRQQLENGTFVGGTAALIQKGYHQKRSGDVVYVFDPAVINYAKTGSTHGSGNAYDTHAPLVFFGKGIKKGSTTRKTQITDIAPTIASLLGITFPNGATGTVLSDVLE